MDTDTEVAKQNLYRIMSFAFGVGHLAFILEMLFPRFSPVGILGMGIGAGIGVAAFSIASNIIHASPTDRGLHSPTAPPVSKQVRASMLVLASLSLAFWRKVEGDSELLFMGIFLGAADVFFYLIYRDIEQIAMKKEEAAQELLEE